MIVKESFSMIVHVLMCSFDVDRIHKQTDFETFLSVILVERFEFEMKSPKDNLRIKYSNHTEFDQLSDVVIDQVRKKEFVT